LTKLLAGLTNSLGADPRLTTPTGTTGKTISPLPVFPNGQEDQRGIIKGTAYIQLPPQKPLLKEMAQIFTTNRRFSSWSPAHSVPEALFR